MTCVVLTPGFGCSQDPDPLNQKVYDFVAFDQSLSIAGSEWARSPSSIITFNQSDYFIESLSSAISFVDSAVGVRDIAASLSHAMSLAEVNTVAGGRTGGGGITEINAEFDSTTLKGMALYVPSDGHVELAQANGLSTSDVIGLANEDVSASTSGTYITEGALDRDDWTSVAGTEFLTPGAVYYLDPSTAGMITATAPTTAGQTVVEIGRASTSTQLDIEISTPILL